MSKPFTLYTAEDFCSYAPDEPDNILFRSCDHRCGECNGAGLADDANAILNERGATQAPWRLEEKPGSNATGRKPFEPLSPGGPGGLWVPHADANAAIAQDKKHHDGMAKSAVGTIAKLTNDLADADRVNELTKARWKECQDERDQLRAELEQQRCALQKAVGVTAARGSEGEGK